MDKIVIAGYGGFAREIKFLIDRINKETPLWDFCGYVVDDDIAGDVFGNDEYICNMKEKISVVIAVGSSELRKKIYNLYQENPNILFPNIIDPSVIMADDIKMGQGNIICAGSILTTGITLGNFDVINLHNTIGHDSVIADYVTINPGCSISGNVTIGYCSNIGTGTRVIQGISIDEKVVTGAGSVIIDHITEGSTAVGIPARTIKKHGERI